MRAIILVLSMAMIGGLALAQAAPENVIRVEIDGLRNSKGNVICGLYSSPEGFAKNGGKTLAQTKSPIAEGRAFCDFKGIQPGRYAVSVFHDENDNGKMDTNFLGIPREGVGASNNAKGHFGPPKFDDAAFQFAGGRMELKIAIVYL